MLNDFYMSAAIGSNLYSGSTLSPSPIYSSLAGNWASHVFTPTDGSSPTLVSIGDWVSIYVTGNAVTPYVARVTALGTGPNAPITLSSTQFIGTAPATQTGTANIVDGGAWASFAVFGSGAVLNTGNLATNNVETRVNIQAGTYANTTTSYSCSLAAGLISPFWLRGFQNTIGDLEGVANPTPGSQVPLISFTTGNMTFAGIFTFLDSLAFTSASSSATVVITGSKSRLYGVAVQNTGAGSGSIALSSAGQIPAIFCTFSAPTTASSVVAYTSNQALIDGCTISGGTVGIVCASYNTSILNCVLTGQAGDSVTYTTGNVYVLNNSIYNLIGNGVNMIGGEPEPIYLRGNHFHGMPTGKYAINASAANGGFVMAVANSYYNVAGTINNVTGYPLPFDAGVLPTQGLANPASGNFAMNPVGWGIGFPNTFLNLPLTIGRWDTGAVQHQGTPVPAPHLFHGANASLMYSP